jgi:hypothetical protein
VALVQPCRSTVNLPWNLCVKESARRESEKRKQVRLSLEEAEDTSQGPMDEEAEVHSPQQYVTCVPTAEEQEMLEDTIDGLPDLEDQGYDDDSDSESGFTDSVAAEDDEEND